MVNFLAHGAYGAEDIFPVDGGEGLFKVISAEGRGAGVGFIKPFFKPSHAGEGEVRLVHQRVFNFLAAVFLLFYPVRLPLSFCQVFLPGGQVLLFIQI